MKVIPYQHSSQDQAKTEAVDQQEPFLEMREPQQQQNIVPETPKTTSKKRGRPSKKEVEAEKQRIELERLEKERYYKFYFSLSLKIFLIA